MSVFPRCHCPYFNPRSHERSDGYGRKCPTNFTNFNPRSHERSDSKDCENVKIFNISIHAPTRGATEGADRQQIIKIISIHAPTRGATEGAFLILMLPLFQSTLPREERPKATNVQQVLRRFQSTLPREERRNRQKHLKTACNFNPRSHERSDANPSITDTYIVIFQSTLPREERRRS